MRPIIDTIQDFLCNLGMKHISTRCTECPTDMLTTSVSILEFLKPHDAKRVKDENCQEGGAGGMVQKKFGI
jgi:hypothetical protein